MASKTSKSSSAFVRSPFRELIATSVKEQQRDRANEAGAVKNNVPYEREAEVNVTYYQNNHLVV
ncbi:hypothetical protein [Pantoea agglomerans]|uniref:hypothetical protein n=1 Tax=Enterobacter agglomerans TaxID=549 RepID=UPI001FC87255|nr:hypothetical protein [Pantoea agglomerans]